MVSLFQVQLVIFHISPGLAMCRRKRKLDTREDENTLSTHAALFLCQVRSQDHFSLEFASGAENCWSGPLTMVMMNSNEDILGLIPCRFLFSLNCLDHFPVDPAIAPVRANEHQLVTLCRSICAGQRAQIWDPLIASKCFTTYFITFVAFLSSLYFPVHRIRSCSSTFGTGCCTFWSTCCWHKQYQGRPIRSKSSASSCALKAHVQKEESVGSRWSRPVLRHWSHRYGQQA